MKEQLTDNRREKWDRRFLQLAKFISSWSKDPSTKVGAIIVDENNIVIGLGYNGFPRNVLDLEEHYLDRDFKYKLIVHAEINAILNSTKSINDKYSTIYIWPLFSCNECAKFIIQSGIKRVVSIKNEKNENWNISLVKYMYDSSGIEYKLYDENFL